jgi:hypothetical protein
MMTTSNTARIFLAASLAPAAPALLLLIWWIAVGDYFAWWGFGLFVILGYMAMLLVGVPLLLAVRRKGWSLNLWRCIGAGVLSGVLLILPLSTMDLLLGANPLSAKLTWALTFAGAAVLAGAIAGLVFRIIAGSKAITRI